MFQDHNNNNFCNYYSFDNNFNALCNNQFESQVYIPPIINYNNASSDSVTSVSTDTTILNTGNISYENENFYFFLSYIKKILNSSTMLNIAYPHLFHMIHSKYGLLDLKNRAITAANNFTFPSSVYHNDFIRLVNSNYNWEKFVLSYRRDDKYNESSCIKYFSDQSNFDILKDIASNGIRIFQQHSFVYDKNIDHIKRPSNNCLSNVFQKHTYNLIEKGRAIVLPIQELLKLNLSNLHFSPLHWVPKVDDDLGRFIIDCSNSIEGSHLNTDESLEFAKHYYGDMSLPSIQSIITDWFQWLKSKNYTFQDCLLFKNDITSAFSQLSFECNTVPCMATVITEELAMIHLSGVFGLNSMPIVWACIGNALLNVIKKRFTGCLHLYVDDFMGLSTKDNAMEDQSIIINTINGVFNNPTADAISKRISPSTNADLIGFHIDIIHETIRPCDRAIEKLLYYFTFSNQDDKYSKKDFEGFHSRADKYSQTILGMRPFVNCFSNFATTFKSDNIYIKKKMSSSVKLSFVIWQYVALLCYEKPLIMSVPLYLFNKSRQPDYILWSDASYIGIGVAIYSNTNTLLAYTQVEFPFKSLEFKHSRYQNAREYVGYFVALFFFHIKYPFLLHPNIMWINDNTQALHWAERNRCNSLVTQIVHIITSWFSIMIGVPDPQVYHIPGISMENIDNLSRFLPHSFPKDLFYDISKNNVLNEFLLLLDFSKSSPLQNHVDVIRKVINIFTKMS